MVIPSVLSSVQGWKTAAARLAVLIDHRAGAWAASCLATGTQ